MNNDKIQIQFRSLSWDMKYNINQVREHSHMTSNVFWVFLTYLPTLIRSDVIYECSLRLHNMFIRYLQITKNIHAMKHIKSLKTCQKYVPIERKFFVFELGLIWTKNFLFSHANRFIKTEAHVLKVIQIGKIRTIN